MIKKCLYLLMVVIAAKARAQFDESRVGIFANTNQYYVNANFLSSRSATGFGAGFVVVEPVTEHSEMMIEFGISRFRTEFLGRADEYSEPEWVPFSNDRFNLAVLYDYDVLNFYDDELALGVLAGPNLFLGNKYLVEDDAKESYVLDPYYATSDMMKIDEHHGKGALNLFGTVGVKARYRFIEGSVRYNFSILNTWRAFPAVSDYITFSGRDAYLNLQLTFYIWGD